MQKTLFGDISFPIFLQNTTSIRSILELINKRSVGLLTSTKQVKLTSNGHRFILYQSYFSKPRKLSWTLKWHRHSGNIPQIILPLDRIWRILSHYLQHQTQYFSAITFVNYHNQLVIRICTKTDLHFGSAVTKGYRKTR